MIRRGTRRRLILWSAGSLLAVLASWSFDRVAGGADAGGEVDRRQVGPAPAGWRRGTLAVAHVGIQSFQGKSSEVFGVGFRGGVLLGRRLGERVSLNGELTVDVGNRHRVLPDRPLSFYAADLVFSPLYHAVLSPAAMVVAGPRLGLWGGLGQEHVGDVSNDTWTRGVSAGLQLGAFFGVASRAALGGLISLGWRKPLYACYQPSSGAERCASDGLGDGVFNIGMTAAALF